MAEEDQEARRLLPTSSRPPYFSAQAFHRWRKPAACGKLAGNSVQVIQKHYLDLQTLDAKSVMDLLDFSATPPQIPPQTGSQKTTKSKQ
jgi:hypothetical protein